MFDKNTETTDVQVSCLPNQHHQDEDRLMALARLRRSSSAASRPDLMTSDVLQRIRSTIGSHRAESGGMLGRDESGLISHFFFDSTGSRSSVTYTPDVENVNHVLNEWNEAGVRLAGFVHSHPRGVTSPSGGDRTYAERILEAIPDLSTLLLPIVMSAVDGAFELLPYTAVRTRKGIKVQPASIKVVPTPTVGGEARGANGFPDSRPSITVVPPAPLSEYVSARVLSRDGNSRLDRVTSAYDLTRLDRSRVLCVGLGGGRAFVSDLARAGVAEFVLIDPDSIEECNVATQQVYVTEIGDRKVHAAAREIAAINPDAVVVAIPRSLDDLDDDFVQVLLDAPFRFRDGDGEVSPLPPVATLLCGMTDSFDAQARVNRLSLQFGVPSLCAQVYRDGLGAELTFTVRGITPACHRCALGGRYRAYAAGYVNDVGSSGTPIFATQRLNSLKGFIALAILQRGGSHPRWAELIEKAGNRSLIQLRMDPRLSSALGISIFDEVYNDPHGRSFFDEALWLPQLPENPETGFLCCADCGGTGDIGDALGSFLDTREFRVQALEGAPCRSEVG